MYNSGVSETACIDSQSTLNRVRAHAAACATAGGGYCEAHRTSTSGKLNESAAIIGSAPFKPGQHANRIDADLFDGIATFLYE